MHTIEISSLEDPRIANYRNIKDRTLRGESLFIAEGELVVERLAESRYGIHSLFLDRAHEDFLNRIERVLQQMGKSADFPVYVTETGFMRAVVGYDFHLGIMATGIRQDQSCLAQFMAGLYDDIAPTDTVHADTVHADTVHADTVHADTVHSCMSVMAPLSFETRRRLVVLPSCVKPDNLGSVFRSSTALGVNGIVLGHDSCDPLGRRALRTSMAATVKMPWVRCDNDLESLIDLKRRYGFQLVGTVLADRAVDLEGFEWPNRAALLLGNEYAGLDEPTMDLCDHLVRIPMQAGVDSLNVGVSAGIFLYEMARLSR